MEILITRNWTKLTYTIGRIFVPQYNFYKNTLEPARGSGQGKPNCNERIKEGTYVLKLHNSPSQKRLCIHVTKPNDNAFNLRYILFHPVNSPKDTKGCIGVGDNDRVGWLSNSRKAIETLESFVIPAIKRGEVVTLKITS